MRRSNASHVDALWAVQARLAGGGREDMGGFVWIEEDASEQIPLWRWKKGYFFFDFLYVILFKSQSN